MRHASRLVGDALFKKVGTLSDKCERISRRRNIGHTERARVSRIADDEAPPDDVFVDGNQRVRQFLRYRQNANGGFTFLIDPVYGSR